MPIPNSPSTPRSSRLLDETEAGSDISRFAFLLDISFLSIDTTQVDIFTMDLIPCALARQIVAQPASQVTISTKN
jgi:hypothetical protein